MAKKKPRFISKTTQLFNKVKRTVEIYNNPERHARFYFRKYFENLPVSDNEIYIEAFTGDEISGNPFYLLKQICEDERLSGYKIYVGAVKQQMGRIKERLDFYGFDRVTLLKRNSKAFCRVLATARYIICDVTLPSYFIKKPGQIYLNTWHGTPLKGLGRSIMDSPNSIGNVQRNFLMTDYLLSPNRYTLDILRRDYMITNLYQGRYVLSGYPRNDALFDEAGANALKEELGLSGKKIIVYMPTWRTQSATDTENIHLKKLVETLDILDRRLPEDTVVLAKLHHLTAGSIDFSDYGKVLPFPVRYETYNPLAMADCLLTDYSSVMFDFANTGRKIVLYAYDAEEYQNTRSMYTTIDTLPFVITTEPESLVRELSQLDSYESYTDQIHDFIAYDNPHSAKDLIDLVFFGQQAEGMEVIDGRTYYNGKQNVLVFTGALAQNGMTSALKSLMNMVDHTERNYFLLFSANSVNHNKMTIHEFPKCSYIPIQGQKVMSYPEAFCRFVYYFFKKDFKFTDKAIDTIMRREVQRLFCGIKFDHLIHYSGYEKDIMELFARMDGKKAIYVHNDLIAESRTKGNLDIKCVEKAYKNFDQIVAIREGTKEELVCSSEDIREKVVLTHNLIDYHSIIERSKLPLVFDTCEEYVIVKKKEVALTAATESTLSKEELERMLDDNSIVKFINIGRFSYEKGHERLIEAFEIVRDLYDNARLIIIGGYGPIYHEVLERAQASRFASDIVVIKSLSNVFPVLTKCSAFVLSSYYEGLPVTIMEALVLGKTVISTDIVGPRAFLSQGYGHLVEESPEAIAEGMTKFIEGTLPPARFFDAEEFNRNAIREFESLFD